MKSDKLFEGGCAITCLLVVFIYLWVEIGFWAAFAIIFVFFIAILFFNKENNNKKEQPMDEVIYVRKKEAILKDMGLNPVSFSEEYYNEMNRISDEVLQFVHQLSQDAAFREENDNLRNVNIEFCQPDNQPFGRFNSSSFEGKMQLLTLMDLTRSMMKAGHQVDFARSEYLGVYLYLLKLHAGIELTYDTVPVIMQTNTCVSMQGIVEQIMGVPEPEATFWGITMLSEYSEELSRKYYLLLYRYIALAAKSDGVVSKQEARWKKELMTRCNAVSSTSTRPTDKSRQTESDTASQSWQETLQSLIGLASVKQEVMSLTNLVKISQQRKEKGMKIPTPSYHCVFTGNPGTGKTTVARLLASMYKELGIIKRGQLIETDRSGLVAEYVGQTAVKTNKIIDKALDGVLFIDEAYSLVNGGETDYGAEAIATLLKRMEDDRDRLIVILAGYTTEMQQFIDSNPGLQSRFNRYIFFPDYNADELMGIFLSMLHKYDYTLTSEADATYRQLFIRAVEEKDRNFGNARFVRNIFDKTIENQANRLAPMAQLTEERLKEIVEADVPKY